MTMPDLQWYPQEHIRISCFCFLNLFISVSGFSAKVTFLSDKCFRVLLCVRNGYTVSLHKGSLEITLTVPLIIKIENLKLR